MTEVELLKTTNSLFPYNNHFVRLTIERQEYNLDKRERAQYFKLGLHEMDKDSVKYQLLMELFVEWLKSPKQSHYFQPKTGTSTKHRQHKLVTLDHLKMLDMKEARE